MECRKKLGQGSARKERCVNPCLSVRGGTQELWPMQCIQRVSAVWTVPENTAATPATSCTDGFCTYGIRGALPATDGCFKVAGGRVAGLACFAKASLRGDPPMCRLSCPKKVLSVARPPDASRSVGVQARTDRAGSGRMHCMCWKFAARRRRPSGNSAENGEIRRSRTRFLSLGLAAMADGRGTRPGICARETAFLSKMQIIFVIPCTI